MKSTEFLGDAVRYGAFPDREYNQQWIDYQVRDSVKLSDVSETLSIWRKGEFLVLNKDQSAMVGFVKVSNISILDNIYNHIDLIYIKPEFRKTSAIKWLLYAVKEYAGLPVIADGAIFSGGEEVIMSLSKYGLAQPSVLNKITGEKSELTAPVNDPNLCYFFESTKLGPGKNYIAEDAADHGPGWVWYAETLFEKI